MAEKHYSKIRNLLFFLEFFAGWLFSSVVRLIPLKFAGSIASVIGKILYYIDKRDIDIAFKNFEVIYKNNPITKEEQVAIIKRSAVNTVRYFIEFFNMDKITAKNYEKYIVFEGYDSLIKAYSAGKGVIGVTLHMFNWDYLGLVPAKLGYPVDAVLNRQLDPYSDKWLKNMREKHSNIKTFYNEVTDLVGIVRALRKGHMVALVADQTHYRKPIFVPFFGQSAATADGPAKLHLRTGAPLLICHSYMREDGKYVLNYSDPVTFEKTSDEDADCKKIMTWVNSQFEGLILKHIDQWFTLFHNRWEFSSPDDFKRFDNDIY